MCAIVQTEAELVKMTFLTLAEETGMISYPALSASLTHILTGASLRKQEDTRIQVSMSSKPSEKRCTE